MPNYVGRDMADGVYARRPWTDYLASQRYQDAPEEFPANSASTGPNALHPEDLVYTRMANAVAEDAPPRETRLFRARFGYEMGALSIEDVLNVDSIYGMPYRPGMDNNSGGPAETNASSTPSNYVSTLGNT